MPNHRISMPSKNELEQLYFVQHFSIQNCADHYNTSRRTIEKWLKYFNLSKTKEQIKKDKEYHNIQKYGYAYPMQNKEIQNKLIKTNMQKYGCAYSCNNLEVIQKKEQTNMQKYGCKCSLSNEKINKKSRSTSLLKYGVEVPMQSKMVQEKSKQTCLKKYGFEYANQAELVKQKIKDTTQKHYGVTCSLCDKSVQLRIKKTNLKKYGAENYQQKDIRHLDIWNNDSAFVNFIKNNTTKETIKNIRQYFNLLDDTVVLDKIHRLNLENFVELNPNHSQYEDEIYTLLQTWGIKNVQRNIRILDNQEIDLFLPDYKLGIEFNGDYWHSDIQNAMQDYSGRSRYHQNKSLLAESKGIFLFHIFEHEWAENYTSVNKHFKNSKENIKNRLLNILHLNTDLKISARKCVIKEITAKEKQEFLNTNHIQQNDQSAYNLGLLYNQELVACMTFKKSKYKKYQWELSRFCTKHNTIVQGGASRLFIHFVNNKMKTGDKIVSYNDITKTKGDIYKTLGFVCMNISAPNYWWINFSNLDIRTRYQEQKAGENERMHSQGYHRVCDCGVRTWVYTKNK